MVPGSQNLGGAGAVQHVPPRRRRGPPGAQVPQPARSPRLERTPDILRRPLSPLRGHQIWISGRICCPELMKAESNQNGRPRLREATRDQRPARAARAPSLAPPQSLSEHPRLGKYKPKPNQAAKATNRLEKWTHGAARMYFQKKKKKKNSDNLCPKESALRIMEMITIHCCLTLNANSPIMTCPPYSHSLISMIGPRDPRASRRATR